MTKGLWLNSIGKRASSLDELIFRIHYLRLLKRPVLRSWLRIRPRSSIYKFRSSMRRLLWVDLTAGEDTNVAQSIRFDALARTIPNLWDLLRSMGRLAFWRELSTLTLHHRSIFKFDLNRTYKASWSELVAAALLLDITDRMLKSLDAQYIYLLREKGLFSLSLIVKIDRLPVENRPRLMCLQHGTLFEDHMPSRCEAYGCFTKDYQTFLQHLGHKTFLFNYWSRPCIHFDASEKPVFIAINSTYLCDTDSYTSAVCEFSKHNSAVIVCHPADQILPKFASKLGVDVVIGIGQVRAASAIWFDQSTAGFTVNFDGPIFRVETAKNSVLQEKEIYEETSRIRGY